MLPGPSSKKHGIRYCFRTGSRKSGTSLVRAVGSDEKALAEDYRPSRATCKSKTLDEAWGASTSNPERKGEVASAAAEVDPGAGLLGSARKK